VPALVSLDVWERVQRQLQQNRSLPKGNATRVYLLRGKIRCGVCGSTYVGSPGALIKSGRMYYYRCSQLGTSNQPTPQKRCRAVALRADWLETCIWDDCRAFIQNPGEALAEAQRQLEARLALRGQGEGERQRLQRALSEQMAAREGILLLLRRRKVTLEEAEAQLEAIAQDSEALRTQLSALRAQQDLAEALKAQYTAATTLLGRLQERLEEIERTNDVQAKRELVEFLVVRIDADTIETGRRAKQAELDITYTFVPKRVVSCSTAHRIDRP
jgi:site-specific DNA recombinase